MPKKVWIEYTEDDALLCSKCYYGIIMSRLDTLEGEYATEHYFCFKNSHKNIKNKCSDYKQCIITKCG